MSLAALAVTATTAHAAVLSVDFGNTNFGSVTQAGFELFNADGNSSSSDTRIYSTDSGDVDVTVNGKRTADGPHSTVKYGSLVPLASAAIKSFASTILTHKYVYQ